MENDIHHGTDIEGFCCPSGDRLAPMLDVAVGLTIFFIFRVFGIQLDTFQEECMAFGLVRTRWLVSVALGGLKGKCRGSTGDGERVGEKTFPPYFLCGIY